MDKEIREELDRSYLPWEMKQGKKHCKLYVQGRLVGILPLDGKKITKSYERHNTIAQIRRAVQSILSEGSHVRNN
jgi:hypothetical protein